MYRSSSRWCCGFVTCFCQKVVLLTTLNILRYCQNLVHKVEHPRWCTIRSYNPAPPPTLQQQQQQQQQHCQYYREECHKIGGEAGL